MTMTKAKPLAYCNECGASASPANPYDPNPLRWKLPSGWVLVRNQSGDWQRRCAGCEEQDRSRYRQYLRSPERMTLILGVLRRFWEQYPDRQIGEIIQLAARLRHTQVDELGDVDLAAVLRFWTLSDADREYENRNGLAAIDPWATAG
jgi:hypothetical protein